MELIYGKLYQYGVSVFDEEPVRFPPETIQKIVANFSTRLAASFENTIYRICLSTSVQLGGDVITPDIVILDDSDAPVPWRSGWSGS